MVTVAFLPTRKEVNMKLVLVYLFGALFCFPIIGATTSATESPQLDNNIYALPLISQKNFDYAGAFTLPDGIYGESEFNFNSGVFTFSDNGKTIFIMGHSHGNAIAEISIPELKKANSVNKLNSAEVIQPFTEVLKKVANNPQNINSVTGMIATNNGIFLNAVTYYDAAADNTDTSLFIVDSSNIARSKINSFFSLEGKTNASGWISEVPEVWRKHLKSDYLVGYASNIPINTRLSHGPSAYPTDLDNAIAKFPNKFIPGKPFIDYPLENMLHPDINNESKANKLWTEISAAYYGFIVPGTATYAVIGISGGTESGIGYKATRIDGSVCPGPCAYDPSDNYNFIWLYDVFDMFAVKKGKLFPHEVKPYSFSRLNIPFQFNHYKDKRQFMPINGASYNTQENRLYISIAGAGQTSKFNALPVIIAYDIKL